MTESYRTSHASAGTGRSYDDAFENGYLHHLWWAVERPLLIGMLQGLHRDGARSVLDFACGTGRITQVDEAIFDHCYGIDVSADMMKRAQARCPRTTFVEHDVTRGRPDVPLVDVVTSFRFLLNAEPMLRSEVLVALHQLLRPGGHLVFNVQWNAHSPSGLAYRVRNRLRGTTYQTAAACQASAWARAAGFEVLDVRGYGLLPWLGDRFDVTSAAALIRAERLADRLPPLRRLGQHLLVLARRP